MLCSNIKGKASFVYYNYRIINYFMKLILKRFAQVLLIAFIVIQFIRPTKNNSKDLAAKDITTKYAVPNEVQTILVTSCYDCHSNHTNYPWYVNIQPIAWWLNDHIKEGKKELNFSVFSSYKIGIKGCDGDQWK